MQNFEFKSKLSKALWNNEITKDAKFVVIEGNNCKGMDFDKYFRY
jgi:hypothetical protein